MERDLWLQSAQRARAGQRGVAEHGMAQCHEGFCTQNELGLAYNKITISLHRKIKLLPMKYKNPMAVLYYKTMTHPGMRVFS